MKYLKKAVDWFKQVPYKKENAFNTWVVTAFFYSAPFVLIHEGFFGKNGMLLSCGIILLVLMTTLLTWSMIHYDRLRDIWIQERAMEE